MANVQRPLDKRKDCCMANGTELDAVARPHRVLSGGPSYYDIGRSMEYMFSLICRVLCSGSQDWHVSAVL